MLILFMKVRSEATFLQKKAAKMIVVACISIAIIYFIYTNGNTRQSIADGYFYLLIENITKNILPYGDVLVVFLIGCLLAIMIMSVGKKNKNIMKFFMRIGSGGIILLWLINCIQLPIYTNQITGGESTQEDSLKLAEYLNKNDYEFIYYVVSSRKEGDNYIRNFYGYMKQPHQVISPADVKEILENYNNEKVVFLVSTEFTEKELEIYQMKKTELELNKLMVYIVA